MSCSLPLVGRRLTARWAAVALLAFVIGPAVECPCEGDDAPDSSANHTTLTYDGRTLAEWTAIIRRDLKDEARQEAYAALAAFARVKEHRPAAVDAMAAAVEAEESGGVLRTGLNELYTVDPQRGTAARVAALSSGKPTRIRAAAAAYASGYVAPDDVSEQAVAKLIDAAAGEDPEIRKLAVEALAHLSTASELDMTQDPPRPLREPGQFSTHSRRIVPVLMERLRDDDKSVRTAAANALSLLGATELAVPELLAQFETGLKKWLASDPRSDEGRAAYSEFLIILDVVGRPGRTGDAAMARLKDAASELDSTTPTHRMASMLVQRTVDRIEGRESERRTSSSSSREEFEAMRQRRRGEAGENRNNLRPPER